MRFHRKLGGVVAIGLICVVSAPVDAASATTVIKYGWKGQAGYDAKWAAPFGPGEGTVKFANNSVAVNATPFTTSSDFGVFDHLKYIRVSSESFAVPEEGSLKFSVDITARTPGTEKDRVVHGCYGPSMSWQVGDPCAQPYAEVVGQGRQAGVVLNMVDFATGQLFDWFVSGNQAIALIERLPSEVTGSGDVGLDKAYTQLIKAAPIQPGSTHRLAIRYTRAPGKSYVEFFMDGALFTRVNQVGIPLDVQGKHYLGYAPSLGPGEELSIDSFSIGHGLFSLVDAFPYQHSERPDLSVSIPTSERIFGQGAVGKWKNFQVTTTTR